MNYQDLHNLEKNTPVETLSLKQIQLWPYLRKIIEFRLERKQFKQVNIQTHSKLNRLKYSFLGIRRLFKSYDTIIFTQSHFHGKYANPILKKLKENTLLIETASPDHNKHQLNNIKNFMSYSVILLLSIIPHLYLFFIPIKNRKNLLGIEKLLKQHRLALNIRSLSRNFVAQTMVISWVLKKLNPKRVFIVCYYGNHAAVKAARDLDIPVIEAQHGHIETGDIAYIQYKNLDAHLFPSHLLAFGESVKDALSGFKSVIPLDNIIKIGSPNIQSIRHLTKNKLPQRNRHFEKRVCISGQNSVQKHLLNWLSKAAMLSPKTHFIYCPRIKRITPELQEIQRENISISINSIYDEIKVADCHVTVYSTTALEAPVFGKANILLNIEKMAENFFSDLVKTPYTKLVHSAEEWVSALASSFPSEDDIKSAHKHFFSDNYEENLDNFIAKL